MIVITAAVFFNFLQNYIEQVENETIFDLEKRLVDTKNRLVFLVRTIIYVLLYPSTYCSNNIIINTCRYCTLGKMFNVIRMHLFVGYNDLITIQ